MFSDRALHPRLSEALFKAFLMTSRISWGYLRFPNWKFIDFQKETWVSPEQLFNSGLSKFFPKTSFWENKLWLLKTKCSSRNFGFSKRIKSNNATDTHQWIMDVSNTRHPEQNSMQGMTECYAQIYEDMWGIVETLASSTATNYYASCWNQVVFKKQTVLCFSFLWGIPAWWFSRAHGLCVRRSQQ